MPQFSISNPQSLTQSVSSIGDALFGAPSGAGQIQGQLDAAQYQQRMAGAAASQALADQRALQLQSIQNLVGALERDPNFLNTPEGMSYATAQVFGGYDDPRTGMEALPGAAVLVNPNVWSEADRGAVLSATGVQSFPNTAAGQARALDGDTIQTILTQDALTERQAAQNQFNLENPQVARGTSSRSSIAEVFTPNPLDHQRMMDTFTDQLDAAGLGNLPEEAQLWAQQRLSELIQQNNGNATETITQVITELAQAQSQTPGAIGRGLNAILKPLTPPAPTLMERLDRIGQPELTPTPESTVDAPVPSLGGMQEGDIRVSQSTGRAMIRMNGQLREISEGETIVHPLTGAAMIFMGGQLHEVTQ